MGKRQPAGGKRVKMKIGFQCQQWGYWIGRLILGSIFIYAAIFKMGAPQDFADSIADYQILPVSVINLFALGLPLFELVCGLLTLSGVFFRVGAIGIISMLAVFIAALAVALFRGLSIDCGCFGAYSWLDSNPWIDLLRDGILLGLGVFIYGHSLRQTQRQKNT